MTVLLEQDLSLLLRFFSRLRWLLVSSFAIYLHVARCNFW